MQVKSIYFPEGTTNITSLRYVFRQAVEGSSSDSPFTRIENEMRNTQDIVLSLLEYMVNNGMPVDALDKIIGGKHKIVEIVK